MGSAAVFYFGRIPADGHCRNMEKSLRFRRKTRRAGGRLPALIQHGVKIWDFAAGRVILEEAGGAFWSRELAPPQWELVATTPALMPDFLIR